MSFEYDEEILQDFLVEAGEILELLQSQLVILENTPDDKELLNAIFRGFHTVKGGAGFLSLTPMVDICHESENTFDLLRNSELMVSPELMDVIFQSLDTVNEMFLKLQERQPLTPAKESLIETLKKINESKSVAFLKGVKSQPAVKQIEEPPKVESQQSESIEQISDVDFEALLDELHGKNSFSSNSPVVEVTNEVTSEDISDLEFEELLDKLHGTNNPVAPTPEYVTQEPDKMDTFIEKIQEKVVTPAKIEAQVETSVRVDTARLDDIMNMVGELVLVRNRLLSLGVNFPEEELQKALANLDVVTSDLQGSVMKTRMQPIKKVFSRFPRVVRDLSRQLGKEIDLVLLGEDTDLDKNLVEALADPLVHLVRNAVDHGIEVPSIREKSGKPSGGKITLAASQEGDHILLRIQDDGAGMDAEKLKSIGIARKIIDEEDAARMSDQDAYALILAPGFSTKSEVSDISGRGVGMDVVKTRITQLNGTISINSERGEGSTFLIKVPLTLAIMPTLMIAIGEQTFALPLSSVNEIFNLDLSKTHVVDGQLTVVVRDKAMPLFYLDQWLVKKQFSRPDSTHVVVVQLGLIQVGFVVDTLIGQEEVVIKPLGNLLHGTAGISGATITSDGKIALILDVPSLLAKYAKNK